MLWGCFAAGGTGALHKIDGIMRKENYVDILKQHLKTSARKLKLGRKWVFQMDNDPKHTSKVLAKQFNICFSRPVDISPKIKIFVPMCTCKL